MPLKPTAAKIQAIAPLAAPLCTKLHTAAFGAHDAWEENFLAKLLFLPTTRGLFALVDDVPVGFILWQHGPEWGEILTLAVSPARQRQGIAKQLLHAFEAALAEDYLPRAVLDVAADNTAALMLYKKAGYKNIATRTQYYTRADGSKSDAEVMEKAFQNAG